MYQSVKINQTKPQSMKDEDDDFNEKSRTKYYFHNVQFCVYQSKPILNIFFFKKNNFIMHCGNAL